MCSVLEGVRRCYHLGLCQVEIETDSQLLVNWITKGEYNIWYLEDIWDELYEYFTYMEYCVRHIFQEGNAVTDFLAKQGNAMPSQVRRLLRMDMIGLPFLHIS